MEKQNKKYLRILILVQITICFLILFLLFLLSRNISSHNINILHTMAINDVKKYMYDSVDETIIRIDIKRNQTTDQVNELADLASYQLDKASDKYVLKTVSDMNRKLLSMPNGRAVKILITDKKSEEMGVSGETTVSSCTVYKKIHKKKYDFIVCVDQDEINNIVKDQIYQEIHKSIYQENEYICVNKILNYGGGENYAVTLINPNSFNTEGTFLSTMTRDAKGNYPYLKELKGLKENGEIFQTYYFKSNNETISEKMSYAKLYEPFNWVISTEKPLDDVLKNSQELNHYNKKIILMTTVKILFSIIALFLLGIWIVVKSHKKYLEYVSEYVKNETERDSLTKVYTRKSAEKYLKNIMREVHQNDNKVAVILIDIDDFKKVNDSYGHIVGDDVLRKIAQNISMCISPNDRLFRWGGEEFLLVCKEVDEDNKIPFSEKILSNVNCVMFKTNQKNFNVTISMGGTYLDKTDENFIQAVERADKALYRAKNMGKNRYCHE